MRIIALAALALTASGCGAPHSAGSKVFARECAGCHSLSGREHGAVGGDLAIPKLRVADLESFARTMPTPGRLSNADVRAVAEYVHARETHAKAPAAAAIGAR